ncbi:MAG: DUF835 domain-containing protein, partial [Thermoplasmata archaeon]
QGVYASESTLNLSDSEILRCNDGVVVYGSNGTLEGNQIYANARRGIWADGSSFLIKDNVISGNLDNGMRLEHSQDFLVEGNTVGGGIFAFWISLSSNLTLSRNTISSGILSFTTTDDVLVVNSTITSSPENFRVIGGSTVTTLNCSFDDTLVTVTSGSRLYVENFLHVRVVDVDGPPLARASVSLILNQVPLMPKLTDSDGWVRWLVVTYESFDGPGNATFTAVELNVSLAGYNITDNPRSVDMSTSHTEEFEGYLAFSPDGGGEDSLFSQAMIVLAIVIVLLVSIFTFLLAKRRKEEELVAATEASEPFEFEAQEGKGYIFAEDGRKRSFEMLISEIEKGSNGLCFTRTYPPNLNKQHDLSGVKVMWLSRDFDKGGLVPTNLGAIFNQVEKFLGENKDKRNFIVIDGLEYLIAQNDFRKVLKLIHSLRDSIGVGRNTLLIPFNIKSVDERQAALLSGDLEVVR